MECFHHRVAADDLPEGTELFLYAEPVCCEDCSRAVRFIMAVRDSDLCAKCFFARMDRIMLERAVGRKISFEQAGPEEQPTSEDEESS